MNPIEFYVLENDTYAAKYEHNMGNYDGTNHLATKMMLWNNRYGEEDAPMVTTPSIYFYYKNAEDNQLLNYFSIKVDGAFNDFVIQDNKGILTLKRNLSGVANDGKDTNTKNFAMLEFIFNPTGATLKNNDLKELYVEVR